MNFVQEKYDTIIIDSDHDRRMRLRQATSIVPYFGEVVAVGNLHDAVSKLQGEKTWDVIFASSRFSQQEIDGFVREAKQTKQGQDAAYILLLSIDKQDSADLAKNIMNGLDGFLLEPYSVDSLVDITRLASKVKGERRIAREKAGLNLLLSKITNQIDLVAYGKSMGIEHGQSFKVLRELCSGLNGLSLESLKVYHDLAVEVFANAPLPRRVFKSEPYRGASSRVKQLMEKKIAKKLGEGSS